MRQGTPLFLKNSLTLAFRKAYPSHFSLTLHMVFSSIFFFKFCIFKCCIFSKFCNSLSFLLPTYSLLENLNKGWTSIISICWWLLHPYLYPRLLWTLDTFIQLSILYLLLVIWKNTTIQPLQIKTCDIPISPNLAPVVNCEILRLTCHPWCFLLSYSQVQSITKFSNLPSAHF